MRFDDFIIKEDADGKQYVESAVSTLTKNHRGDDNTDDDTIAARMYEQPGSPNCPVASYEKYIIRLNPNCTFLWQRARTNVNENDSIWYDYMVVGKNIPGMFMQKISKEAQLTTILTYHSIRATCLTMLDECGYESRHIMEISKHKSERSLKHYLSKLSDKRNRDMSEPLGQKVNMNQRSEPVVIPKVRIRDVDLTVSVSDTEIYLDLLCDIDDPDLASISDNPDIFPAQAQSPLQKQSKIEKFGQSVTAIPLRQNTVTPLNPYPNQGTMMYNIRGCNVTINNDANNGM